MHMAESSLDRTRAILDAEPEVFARELPQIPRTTPRVDTDWRAALEKRNGRIVGDERNALLALRLAPELAGLVQFNEFALRVEFTRSPPWRELKQGATWTDDDDTAALAWLQSMGVEIRQRHIVGDAVAVIAKDHLRHPVREYMARLQWDCRPRLATWLFDYLGAGGNPAYLGAVGEKILISAIARIDKPGCQADHTLVLEGPQDLGKSRTVRALAMRPDWFTDDMPDIHSKDAALQLCGRWIVELAELAALRRAEIEGVKAFLTRPVDVFRPPYGRRTISVPRQCIFFATTNEVHYLRDPSGNRRFWPVSCQEIDLDALERDRDQLWAEAAVAYARGATWHLTAEETALAREEQSERMLVTELEADVGEYLAMIVSSGYREVSAKQVMIEALHLEPDKPDFAERAGRLGPHVAAAMQAAGWQKVRTSGRGAQRRTIYRKPL
jgi:putative DNA primase/helicase